MCRWGVSNTLDEVIDCPQVVKHTLNDESMIGSAYVGPRCVIALLGLLHAANCTVRCFRVCLHHFLHLQNMSSPR